MGVLVALKPALTPALIAAALLALSAPALAQQTSTTAPVLVPPRPLVATTIAMPAGAPPIAETVEVTVKIRVTTTGTVARVELVRKGGTPFDEAVVEGASRFTFSPATWGGVPVPVDINFTQRFAPPAPKPVEPPAAAEAATTTTATVVTPRLDAVLAGQLREKGTRRPLAFATVVAIAGGRDYTTTSSTGGRFELALPAGKATIRVLSSSHRPFLQLEELKSGERLEVRYLVEPTSANPYELVVTGRRDRTEVARTTLRGRELTQVPGTFGDPFHVIGTLPGVTQIMSLLPFPIVRGSSPGNTGFLVDGVRVPLLFHLLGGPSVIHPQLIDSVEFSPGGFSVDHGGYTGGIVDGKTRSAEKDEKRLDVDLNLFQIGGLVRYPLPFGDARATVAGRYGFPGLLVSLASPRISLSYWDYQLRIDGGDRASGWTLFAFGAFDGLNQVPDGLPDDAEKEPFLHFNSHRIDLRYHHRSSTFRGEYQLTFGYDDSFSEGEASIQSPSVTPHLRWSWEVARPLELRFGLDGLFKQASLEGLDDFAGIVGDLIGEGNEPSDLLLSAGFLVEALWTPWERLLIRPGVRVDVYTDTRSGQLGLDPRLSGRYQLTEDLALKGSVGLYHQPPRFTIPIPGLDAIAFQRGLLEATQVSAGAEARFADEWSVDLQGYFNWMDPILYDVTLNPTVEDLINDPPAAPPGEAPPTPPVAMNNNLGNRLDRILVPATGRSYGLELLLRRESATGVAGWISYTLSRTERLRDGVWAGFDYDRTHILNLVLSVPLPRNWQVGLRAQVQSGRPFTTTSGLATARSSSFVRFDLRIDKTAVWNDWLLDFYVDVSNVVVAAEELSAQPPVEVRYVIPTVGFRGMF